MKKTGLTILLGMILLAIPPATHAPASPGLDGYGTCSEGNCCSITMNPTSYCAKSLSTTHAGDLVVLLASCSTCNITDSQGLKYQLRATSQGRTSGQPAVSEYYALATTALAGDNITLSCDNCDGPFFQAFAVNGYNANLFASTSPSFSDCHTADINNIPCSVRITTTAAGLILSGVTAFAAQCALPSGLTRLENGGFFASDYGFQAQGSATVSYSCIHYVDNGREAFSAGIVVVDAVPLSTS